MAKKNKSKKDRQNPLVGSQSYNKELVVVIDYCHAGPPGEPWHAVATTRGQVARHFEGYVPKEHSIERAVGTGPADALKNLCAKLGEKYLR